MRGMLQINSSHFFLAQDTNSPSPYVLLPLPFGRSHCSKNITLHILYAPVIDCSTMVHLMPAATCDIGASSVCNFSIVSFVFGIISGLLFSFRFTCRQWGHIYRYYFRNCLKMVCWDQPSSCLNTWAPHGRTTCADRPVCALVRSSGRPVFNLPLSHAAFLYRPLMGRIILAIVQ
jgi:hypothetical protein